MMSHLLCPSYCSASTLPESTNASSVPRDHCLPACRTEAPLPRRALRRLPPPAPPEPLLDAKPPSACASPVNATSSCCRPHRASRCPAAITLELSAGHPPSHRTWSTTGPKSCLSSPLVMPTCPRHHPRKGVPPVSALCRLATLAAMPEQPRSCRAEPYHSDSGRLCSSPISTK
jgi:hypothetical protein